MAFKISNIVTQTSASTRGAGSSRARRYVSVGDLASQTLNRKAFYPRHYTGLRSPMILTSRRWFSYLKRVIVLFVNPREMTWNFPRRETMEKTAAGTVRNVWRNQFRGRYYDEPTISMSFQGGNIMPSAGWVQTVSSGVNRGRTVENFSYSPNDPGVPPGLSNFYDFLELLDEPGLIGNIENEHIILHRSRVFPELQIYGYFEPEGFSMPETADDSGNTVTWQAQFRVYRTTPNIFRSSAMHTRYRRWFWQHGFEEGFGNLVQPAAPSTDMPTRVGQLPPNPPDVPPAAPTTGPDEPFQNLPAVDDYGDVPAGATTPNENLPNVWPFP